MSERHIGGMPAKAVRVGGWLAWAADVRSADTLGRQRIRDDAKHRSPGWRPHPSRTGVKQAGKYSHRVFAESFV